jgi:hypothetical protein
MFKKFLQDDFYHPNFHNSSNSDDDLLTHKIRILPSIGHQAGLNKTDFDISLDENLDGWFVKIHETFRQYKKCPQLSNLLQKFYEISPNPYLNGLKFFANCPDNNSPKQNSFSYTG